jgi:tetratricopeptide (TPR) repeat protein
MASSRKENLLMSQKKIYKFLVILWIFVGIAACVQKKPEFSPQQLAEFNLQTRKADELYKKGSYISLKKAYDIYEAQMIFPAFQTRTRKNLLKTALLLALRENELSVVEDKHLKKAMDLIESYPELSEFSPYASIVIFTSPGGSLNIHRGSIGKYYLGDSFEWIKKNIVTLNADLKEKAELDVFYTYYYLTLNTEFRHNLKEEENFHRFSDLYPDSPLIQYKLSIFPELNPQRLKDLFQKNPDFYEIGCQLGNLALLKGKVLTAEKNFLKAHEFIPSSVSILKNLAQIYYRMEEFEESLVYNEKILDLIPDYRDALLGKAICLSYLSRHEKAIGILDNLVELGMYLMGESHYWLAWNLHELGQLDLAMENVKRSLHYLIGHYEVHSLAGIIAFDLTDIDTSEEHFKKALWMNAGDCEASFYMGKISGIMEDWEQSGIHFENAAICNAGMERALKEKIQELEESSLSPGRKERHITRKKIQLIKVQVTKATAFFNAAAGYYNAGKTEKALSLAENSRENKTIKPKAEELISQIKKFNSPSKRGNKKEYQLYS